MHSLRRLLANRDLGLGLLTLSLLGAVGLWLPQFIGWDGLKAMLDDTAILILLALGEMLVILTRCIDLSLAANLALTGMAVALFNHAHPGAGMTAVIALAIIGGTALGMLNGLLVWRLRIPSIVVSLGTLAIYRGLVYVISAGTWVTSNKMSADFLAWVRQPVGGLSALSWLSVIGCCAAWWLLNATRFGRHIYAVGSNPSAAAYVGIDAGRVQFAAFAIAGALAGLCGYLWVARFAVAYTDVAQGFELTVIAACVIGGVSIAGATGTVAGVLLGCLFIGIVRNALPLLGVSPFWQMGVSGAVIIGAVVVNAGARRAPRLHILEDAPP